MAPHCWNLSSQILVDNNNRSYNCLQYTSDRWFYYHLFLTLKLKAGLKLLHCVVAHALYFMYLMHWQQKVKYKLKLKCIQLHSLYSGDSMLLCTEHISDHCDSAIRTGLQIPAKSWNFFEKLKSVFKRLLKRPVRSQNVYRTKNENRYLWKWRNKVT